MRNITSKSYNTDKLLDTVQAISSNPLYSEVFDVLSAADAVEATFTVMDSRREGASTEEICAILVATFIL